MGSLVSRLAPRASSPGSGEGGEGVRAASERRGEGAPRNMEVGFVTGYYYYFFGGKGKKRVLIVLFFLKIVRFSRGEFGGILVVLT